MSDLTGTASTRSSVRPVRGVLLLVVVAEAVAAFLLMFQVPWAVDLAPFPGRTPMSNVFIASLLLAAAASTGWCLIVRSDRALAGIALDTVLIFTGMAVVLFAAAIGGDGLGFGRLRRGQPRHRGNRSLALAMVPGSRLARSRPTPRLVLGSFAVFVAALITSGGLLILRVPNILPWQVTPELSTLFGLMLMSAAAYFAYGLVERRWENAGGQLAGFLAYDIVLIVPLVRQLATGGSSGYDADGSLPVNLILYAAVIIYSGTLALYYLFLDRRTRLWSVGSA